MKTVGEILRESREAKFYSLEEVEKATKIRKELLIALEEDNFTKLPPPTFIQGFIKNYAKFLGLDQGKILAVFRREFSEKKHQPHVMEAFVKPIEDRGLKLTPSRVLGGILGLLIATFFVYLWLQYHQLVGPPTLVVTSPLDQATIDSSIVEVVGKTDPEVKVLVNGQEITVSGSGDFKKEITLSSPLNKLIIVAFSRFGQKTQVERTVYLKR